MPGADGIVVDSAFGWFHLTPDREVRHRFEGGDVVADDGGAEGFLLLAVGEEVDQILRRRLVLGELPNAPVVRPHRHHAALRAFGVGEGPAIRRHRRRIALGHRPGGGRVEDQRRLAGDQCAVVGRIVVADGFRRQEGDQLPGVVQRGADGGGVGGDGALGVHEVGPHGAEDRAPGLHGIGGDAAAEAERKARLVAGLGRLEEGVVGPVRGLGRLDLMRRIERLHVDAGVLLHHADPRAGGQRRRAAAGRHRHPVALDRAQMLEGVGDGAVGGDQGLHHVVQRDQVVGEFVHGPHVEGIGVVAGAGLGFGGHGEVDLATVDGEEVGLDFDLVLVGPIGDQLAHGVVAGGDPVVPEDH